MSDNSKCIRTSEGGREVNFLFPPGVVWMFSGMTHLLPGSHSLPR